MRSIGRTMFWLTLLFFGILASDAFACPNCKEAIASQDGESMRLANGYSWSIILMISMPFALLGTGIMMIARAVKRGVLPEL